MWKIVCAGDVPSKQLSTDYKLNLLMANVCARDQIFSERHLLAAAWSTTQASDRSAALSQFDKNHLLCAVYLILLNIAEQIK
ncbi:hypothetical protein [Bradyrhizobium mercantei]|uniref:hypothetical protein n=1 Tax=Bradyrhizobium mercantei TaxID=1904807 RepID=UPI001178ABDE|nr:hypothetical protein [Bradyrhizobium mercantei]